MAASAFVNQYSRLDRALHRVAFASGDVQVSMADIEDRMYKKQLASILIEQPVFITALPRAGTTILLGILHQTGEFAAHSYRSMPFILCPVIWQRFSRRMRSRNDVRMERAHGDGIVISTDSPEAFEEVVWHQFWSSHYRDDHIRTWGRHNRPAFADFLAMHMRKQIWLAGRSNDMRYLSKNNLNIARIGYLRSLFPDAAIVIPFRDPLQHASSLLKQHLKFLQSHSQDDFSRVYMRGICHYDFGANFLPVNFGNWLTGDRRPDATELEFWVEYWIAAYRYILQNLNESVYLVSFEELTRHPVETLGALSQTLKLRQSEKLVEQAATVRAATPYSVDTRSLPFDLVTEANVLHDSMLSVSRNALKTPPPTNHTAVGYC